MEEACGVLNYVVWRLSVTSHRDRKKKCTRRAFFFRCATIAFGSSNGSVFSENHPSAETGDVSFNSIQCRVDSDAEMDVLSTFVCTISSKATSETCDSEHLLLDSTHMHGGIFPPELLVSMQRFISTASVGKPVDDGP